MITLNDKKLKKCAGLIENSIKKIVAESGSKGVVLGLSGGVDSSVVLKLAYNSGTDVYALILPEESVTRMDDVRDAEDLAKNLGVRYSIIQINPFLESIEKNFPWNKFSAERKQISWGNVKARIRMVLNYLVSNIDNRIVLGTGNKTEILLGYTTKYGDNAVDIQPIGDLYKTQVKQLAEYLKIPKGIIEKEPSAGLWKGQTDEGELGASYRDIDRILHLLVDKKYSIEKTAEKLKVDIELIKSIYSRMNRNEHKRVMPEIVRLTL
ncbi:MAG: NAD+ synthase [Candidatus Altiarchaeales archaeon]|nr:MAG: NAD+ synthase [Candidatus Altiarchaeales archaeon]